MWIDVNKRQATAHEEENLTSGSVGVRLSFRFSPEWRELVKTACFRVGERAVPSVKIPAGGEIIIPAEALEQPGEILYAGVFGETVDGRLVIPTVYTSLGGISQGAEKNIKPVRPPKQDWTVLIEADVRRALAIAESLEARAAAGEFNGVTPVKGRDYWTDEDRQLMVGDVRSALPLNKGELGLITAASAACLGFMAAVLALDRRKSGREIK